MPTLALLDGHSLAYRAFYALPEDLATKSGQVTNSAYGFTSMLIKLLGDHDPEGLAVAWDAGRATFRTEEYPEYKAQRESAPDTFSSQLPLIRQVLETMGIEQFTAPGFEADDIIASLARQAAADGWDVLVVTGDRDSFQLVDDRITVLYTRRGISDIVVADATWIEGKYGVRPDQYAQYAALRGDSSDNLPGVPGVGEKTAARLIASHGSLEGIFEALEDQTPKLRENLAEHRDQVFLNRKLMALVDDMELDRRAEELRRPVPDRDATKALFDQLEFHSLWTRLSELDGGVSAREITVIDVEVVTVGSIDDLDDAATDGWITLDPVWHGDELDGVMVALGPEAAGFIPADRLAIVAELGGRGRLAMGSSKETLRALALQGIVVESVGFDPSVAAYVIDPAARVYELADLADRHLGIELVSPDDEPDTDSAQGTLDFSGGPDLDMAGRQVVVVDRLIEPLRAELEERGALELFDDVEMPLVPVLARMEAAGIGVDRTYLEGLGEELREQLAVLEKEVHDAAGEPFNVNSTKQLRKVLFEDLELPILKKTPKGEPSTDATVLAKLADGHPIVDKLLRFRELEKLRGTYVDGYLPLIADDGRIHAHFNQLGASTGRLSSDRPNLQNIPVRSETGRTIRRAFVPAEGSSFVVADYSQIELRVLAHLSRDPGLLEAFAGEGTDIHTATAARVFGFDPEHVTSEMRRRAKVINFGLLYGMEAFGLAERLEISREEAQEHMDAYFQQFPDVRAFMQNVVAEAKQHGYTTTIFGRRRYLPELTSDNFRIRQMGERMALNAPVQGSAADIIKLAMIEVDSRLAAGTARMVLQVHDELVIEAPTDMVKDTVDLVVETMESVADLAVPLTVDVATGANFAECKP